MKKDFTIGIISGIILTFIGIFIQFQMTKYYEREKEIRKLDAITVKQLDNRLTRSYSILLTSNSTVFMDRWNNYIYTVFYPWNTNLYTLEAHIKQNHIVLYDNFESVCTDFGVIHNLLNDIRKLQNPSTKKEMNKLILKEKEAKEKLDYLTTKIDLLKEKLLR